MKRKILVTAALTAGLLAAAPAAMASAEPVAAPNPLAALHPCFAQPDVLGCFFPPAATVVTVPGDPIETVWTVPGDPIVTVITIPG